MIDRSVLKYFKSDIGVWRTLHTIKKVEELECNLLLEVGVGSHFSVKNKGYMVGIDISAELLWKNTTPFGLVICADTCFLPFRSDIFQIIVSRFLLHHLIGTTPKNTERNIEAMLRESRRVLQRKGKMLIEEWCVHTPLESKILFYITKIFSRLGISLNMFELEPNLIIYFLTINKLTSLLKNNGLEVNYQAITSWKFLSWIKFYAILH